MIFLDHDVQYIVILIQPTACNTILYQQSCTWNRSCKFHCYQQLCNLSIYRRTVGNFLQQYSAIYIIRPRISAWLIYSHTRVSTVGYPSTVGVLRLGESLSACNNTPKGSSVMFRSFLWATLSQSVSSFFVWKLETSKASKEIKAVQNLIKCCGMKLGLKSPKSHKHG